MVKTETLNTTLSYSPSSSIMEDNSTGKKKRSFVDMDMDMVENDKERSVSPGHGLGPLPSSSLALQLVGKHALLFDDDSAAACINSKEALMPWNGDQNLLLDRYDARHLLQDLSALRRRRSSSSSSDASEAELDLERYRDLHDPPHHETSKRQKSTGSGYQTVPFLYSTEETATAGRTSEEAMESSDFKPPFSVPENLLSHLPPTEKVHQIIARTAKFVSEHGGQSEIVLRVKQGSNPVFGFLMPDHHLHVYFRFLVDHLKVLEADKKSDSEQITKSTAGEALSLLGSVYGTGDDEDEGTAHLSVVIKKEGSSMQDYPVNNIAFSEDTCNLLERAESSVQKVLQKDICSTETDATPNKDALVTDKQASILEGSKCMSGDGLGTHDPNLHNLVKNVLLSVQTSGEKVKDIAPILEPPSFLKRIVQKMAEFIARNGKEFECIIMNQDRSTGRFPFLLPFNQYHTYYLKVLEAAQKGELYEDDAGAEKFISPSDVRVHGVQKIKEPKKNINVAGDSSPCVACTSTPEEMNITQAKKTSDPEKKTKFKIVIGGIRKDGLDHGNGKPPGMTSEAAASSVRSATKRPVRVPGFSQGSGGDKDNEKKESGLSADATAAIVMSATRGLWKSQQGVTSESGTFHGGILEKILKGISEDSDGGGSADVGSSHGDASNICSSNGGMALTQSGHHSGISGTSSKLVMDACFSHQQSGDVSGASGSILRLDGSNMKKDDTSAAKVMVKAAALAAACEADSSEACLSREEKLRAERLKRAKKFAALIKSGCHDLGDKNVRSTHEGVGSLQNESNGKAAVCGSSYNGATIQLDSPKAKTSAKISKEESGQMEVLAASKEHGNKSTAKYPDGDGHSDKNHHHHWNDHHECSKSQHDKSDENGNDYEKYGRRHKHKSEKNHKDSVTERYSGKRHYESNSHRSSEDRHRRHRHRSKSRDMDSGMGGNHHHSREDAHWHWSKNISGQKHTKNSSGKEHRKESSHGKEHTKVSSRGKDHTKESSSGKDHSSKDNQEKSAANLLKHTEALASEAREMTTHATDVPDDLRAKVRAMLLATL